MGLLTWLLVVFFCHPFSPFPSCPVLPLPHPPTPVLKILRAKEDVQEEIEELHQEDIAELEEKEMSVLNRLTYKSLRRQIICVVLLMAGQQFTGISAVRHSWGWLEGKREGTLGPAKWPRHMAIWLLLPVLLQATPISKDFGGCDDPSFQPSLPLVAGESGNWSSKTSGEIQRWHVKDYGGFLMLSN